MPSRLKKHLGLLAAATAALTLCAWSVQTIREDWPTRLARDLGSLETEFGGEYGVYAVDFRAQIAVNFKADREWEVGPVLDSCIAAKILTDVEAGQTKLTDRMQVRRSDVVAESDGLAQAKTGEYFTTGELIKRMLEEGDQTAADMLIRKASAPRVNAYCREHIPGLKRILDRKSERREAYAELHRQARGLTNWDFIEIARLPADRQLDAFARKAYVGRSFLRAKSVDEAIARYYARGPGAVPLIAMGVFLEDLTAGRVLNADHTALLNGLLEAREGADPQVNRICGIQRLPFATALVCFRGNGDKNVLREAWDKGAKAVVRHL